MSRDRRAEAAAGVATGLGIEEGGPAMADKPSDGDPNKRTNLGRGLAALFGEESEDFAALDTVRAAKSVATSPRPTMARRAVSEKRPARGRLPLLVGGAIVAVTAVAGGTFWMVSKPPVETIMASKPPVEIIAAAPVQPAPPTPAEAPPPSGEVAALPPAAAVGPQAAQGRTMAAATT